MPAFRLFRYDLIFLFRRKLFQVFYPHNMKLLKLNIAVTNNGTDYYTIIWLEEAGIKALFDKIGSEFGILMQVVEWGKSVISNSLFKDFQVRLWDGKHWLVIEPPVQSVDDRASMELNRELEQDKETAVQKLRLLSKREMEILSLLKKHEQFDKINESVHLNRNTYKWHLKSIYRKLNLNSKAELLLWIQKYVINTREG